MHADPHVKRGGFPLRHCPVGRAKGDFGATPWLAFKRVPGNWPTVSRLCAPTDSPITANSTERPTVLLTWVGSDLMLPAGEFFGPKSHTFSNSLGRLACISNQRHLAYKFLFFYARWPPLNACGTSPFPRFLLETLDLSHFFHVTGLPVAKHEKQGCLQVPPRHHKLPAVKSIREI